MSHFPNMFESTDSLSSFLIHIGRFRECVVYTLSKEGTINDFSAGRIDEALGDPLRLAGYQLLRCTASGLSGYHFESWKDWCEKLNEQDGIALALYDAVEPGDFISHDTKSNSYQPTPKGVAQDKKQ